MFNFNKFELYAITASVFLMAMALYLNQSRNMLFNLPTLDSSEEAVEPITVSGQTASLMQARADAYMKAADDKGNIKRMVIDDIKIGVGEEVKKGDMVAVHYKGTLQSGEEFDNSHKRGQTFEFKVGSGQVIKGWDEGLIGMKVGGHRVLVIPPEMAYGERGIGPIPGNATLVFAIELVEIK
jgi:FKBP-type peptidyl-prolyl cis-trans isomerase